MELTGQQHLPISRDRVWAGLMDPATLKAAIPGCETIADEGNGRYAIGMLAAVGPVKARFKGRLQQQDVQAPQRYILSFEGDGGIAGFAKGSAEVDLREDGVAREHTVLSYRAQAQIGGRLAQIGSRLIDATAAKMSAQFFDRLTQVIQTGAVAGAADAAPIAPATPVTTAAGARGEVAQVPSHLAPTADNVREVVTIQMPAWTWAFTVAVIGLLAAWLAVY